MRRENANVRISASHPVLAVYGLDRSGSWYRDVLGCEVDDPDPGNWRFCRAGDVIFMLGRCPDVPAASELGDHSYVAYLYVDDVDSVHAQATAASADVVNAHGRTMHGGCGSSRFARRTVIGSCLANRSNPLDGAEPNVICSRCVLHQGRT
jgi:uncharacterized glyoxalase superfamily protein PhnB